METLALTRISNVLPCVRELQTARLRMDHELRCRSLPTMLEEESDGFIPKVPLFDCLHAVAQQPVSGISATRRFVAGD